MNRLFLVLSVVCLFRQGLAQDVCSKIPSLQREIRRQAVSAKVYEDAFEAQAQIAQEARVLNKVSSGLAVTSGLIFLAANGLSFYDVMNTPVSGGASRLPLFLQMGKVGSANALLRMIAASPAGLLIKVFGEGYIFGAGILLLSQADIIYYVGGGVYQIVKEGEKYEIDLSSAQQSREALAQVIDFISNQMGVKLENPPGRIKNSLSFGGENARFFSELAQMAELRARLQYDLVKSLQMELSLHESVCRQRP
ncbi:MAG: hypothetical protein ACK5Y2_11925 [Bdellovibrionales bacterium]